jgi:hypothetical protein
MYQTFVAIGPKIISVEVSYHRWDEGDGRGHAYLYGERADIEHAADTASTEIGLDILWLSDLAWGRPEVNKETGRWFVDASWGKQARTDMYQTRAPVKGRPDLGIADCIRYICEDGGTYTEGRVMRVLITESYVRMVQEEGCRYAEVQAASIDEARRLYEETDLEWEDDNGGDVFLGVEFEWSPAGARAAPGAARQGGLGRLGMLMDQLVKLGLDFAAEALPAILTRAVKEDLGTPALLERSLRGELDRREDRRIRTSLRLSGLPTGQTLANFDFAFQPAIQRFKLEALATCVWLREQALLILGRRRARPADRLDQLHERVRDLGPGDPARPGRRDRLRHAHQRPGGAVPPRRDDSRGAAPAAVHRVRADQLRSLHPQQTEPVLAAPRGPRRQGRGD